MGLGKAALKDTLEYAHNYITGVPRAIQGDPMGLSPSNETEAAGADEYNEHPFIYGTGLGILTSSFLNKLYSSGKKLIGTRQKISVNPRTRLPRNNGYWKGEPGNGLWFSDNINVRRITGGTPVKFKNGRPDFSPWVTESMTFKKGIFDGSRNDINLVLDRLKTQYELPSREASRRLLNSMGVTPHHLNSTTLQFVPSKLHNNVPHIGSASDLRGGY